MKELLLISGLGVLSLFSGLINFRKGFLIIVVLGLLANIGLSIADWNGNENVYGKDMLLMDNFALAFNSIFSLLAILWFLSSKKYFDNDNNFSDHFALVLFSLCGGLLLVSFTNTAMLFLGIEILSIPLFVLVGSDKTRLSSNEAAFKYFLLGAFATAFLLFGIALIYGATGSFNIQVIADKFSGGQISPMALSGMILMMVGMSFKVSVAPFHFWAPDVYQGAPTNITALMATVVKTVAFAAFYRLFSHAFINMQFEYKVLFSIAAALTLLIANITAAVQENVKRMLAYSSISHAGFMMIALLCMGSGTSGILLYYTLVYSLSSIAAFTILEIVQANSNGDESISSFKGLSKRSPLMAVVATFAMLSMSGIPPLSGFFAKYLVFTAAVENGYMWLAVVGIIASLIAVYYYFKLIIAMFGQSSESAPIEVGVLQKMVLIVCAIALVALAIFPSTVIGIMG